MSGGDVMVLIAVTGQFALVGLIIFIVAHRLEQKAALRAQLEMKLIERFNSAKELEEFLSTDAGRRLLGARRHGGMQLGKIVGAVQVGVAIGILGIGVLIIGVLSGKSVVIGGAILMIAIGLGLLAAAMIGRELVRSWGLNGGDHGPRPTPEA